MKRGEIFFPNDLLKYKSASAVKMDLSRLTEQGKLVRLAHGIYLYPKRDVSLGILYPSVEEIAKAIARRDKARIIPSGAYALYQLGLSTPVPMRVVYLTDGAPRRIKVGRQTILFKRASTKKLAMKGKISMPAVLALQEIGKDGITKVVLKKLKQILQKEEKQTLLHDARLAPAWICTILISIAENIYAND